ncbi:MAG: ATP-binding cassette domain-containing protein [Actinomycetota bacterium]|nr:ATP-binding cassette domain-containing protein [Actinomycetota bacterium]
MTTATTTTSGPALRVEALTKRYGERSAVDHLTFELPRGVVAGFIGPNGAGKTTTMAMLLGLVKPTSGTGTVLGHPLGSPARFLPRVGALIEGPAMYPGLTGAENLRVLAAMGGRDASRIPTVLEQVGLADRAGDRFSEYSMGMKQRLGIAGALLGDPDLLVLDEPTNGLDPVGMREIRHLIADIASDDRTVLVSSHLLSEIEQVCDWLIVIERGAGVYAGGAAEFLGESELSVAIAPEHGADLGRLGQLLAADGYEPERSDDRLLVPVNGRDPHTLAVSLNRLAHEHGLVLAELEQRRANLEDRYLSLVQGGVR